MHLALPALRLPGPVDLRLVARALALLAALAFAGLVAWAYGPANLVEGLVGEARRSAGFFIGLVGAGIGAALIASTVALFRGKPGWSIGLAVAPLVGLLLMLVR
jgi:hypothetical protein